ncbi:hypothetical protein [Corynebacterium pilosum]|uniref:hypothetical protein n=1 Tax=Corynebacterium pilosum TaxID=35756 RepID=UPI00069FBF13|nr:hypothetical protein [Corynebacterium pilosum]
MSEDLTRQRPSTAPYRMDYDWLWGSPETGGPGNDGSSATVRLTVTGPNARNAVMQWFDDLRPDEFGLRSRGGWLVTEMKWEPEEVIVDITSGGEDVATGSRTAPPRLSTSSPLSASSSSGSSCRATVCSAVAGLLPEIIRTASDKQNENISTVACLDRREA